MNGLALLRAIEQHRIVVTTIFMTGFGDEEVAKNAILEGASDYLTKPVLKGLTQVVERCIERHQDKLQVAALRNAATLLEISEALNQPGGQGRGAEPDFGGEPQSDRLRPRLGAYDQPDRGRPRACGGS